MKKLLLIDGDEFLFRAAAAVEQEVRFNEVLDEPDWNEPPIHVLFSNPVQARQALDEMLERIFERFDTKNHYLCFSSPPNFRFGVDPTYKNNRATSRKPLCYHQLRVDVENDYTCKALPGLEADDVMGIFATCPGIKGQKIIVSQDKDMQTIPGHVWRQGDLKFIDEAEANVYHMFQTLVGDTSDGYKGCPGIGKVKAEKLLADATMDASPAHYWQDVWKCVVAAYEKAGLTEEDAIRQARLARILRWSDWDNEKKQPILWTPTDV